MNKFLKMNKPLENSYKNLIRRNLQTEHVMINYTIE